MTAEEADRLMKTKSRHAVEARMVRTTLCACMRVCMCVYGESGCCMFRLAPIDD